MVIFKTILKWYSKLPSFMKDYYGTKILISLLFVVGSIIFGILWQVLKAVHAHYSN